MAEIHEILGKGAGWGELRSWVFFVVLGLAEEGFLISAGSSPVADHAPWKRSVEGSAEGLEVLPCPLLLQAAVSNNATHSLPGAHQDCSWFGPRHWCGALSRSSRLTRAGAASSGCS